MRMWIVSWVAEGNMPGCDVFTDKEQAFSCLNYMMETGKTAIVKTVNIQAEQPKEEMPEQLEETEENRIEADESEGEQIDE